jgi:hypothetical protein
MSKWMAKRAYSIQLVTLNDYDNLDSKQKVVFDLVRDISERNNIKLPEI